MSKTRDDSAKFDRDLFLASAALPEPEDIEPEEDEPDDLEPGVDAIVFGNQDPIL